MISNSNENKKEEKVIEEKILDVKIVDENYDFSSFTNSYIILETVKENYYNDDFIGISILTEDLKNQVFVPSNIIDKNISLKTYLESNYNKKTFDYKRLYVTLKQKNININNVIFDALLATYLINPSFVNEDLKIVLENFNDTNLKYDENIYGKGAKTIIPELSIVATHSINKCLALHETVNIILENIKENDQEKLLEIWN